MVVKGFSSMFLLGFTIALPIVGVLFLTSIGLGISVRLIPQVNVFMVGYPLKILLGFIMLWLSMAVFAAGLPVISPAPVKSGGDFSV